MPKKRLLGWAIALAAVAAILLLMWLVPLPAGQWGAQERSAGYVDAFEKNDKLDALSYLDLGGYAHPETVLVRDGWVYATVQGGVLLRMREDGSEQTTLLDTGGCLLGFDFDSAGNLLVLDCCYNGSGALLQLDSSTGACEALIDQAHGYALYYPNALAVAADGTVYFTDSSTAFLPSAYGGSSSAAAANEVLMHTCTGRVLAYDPQSGSVRTLADGFAFSNGVALSADEKSLFVCETYAYAVRRIDLETGIVHDFLSNLPGFPDNLTKGLDGRYWVGLNGERSDSLDDISQRPLLRKALWLYGKLSPAGDSDNAGYCHVFAFTEESVVTDSLQSGSNGYYRSTGGTETPERLYLQSINGSGRLAYVEYSGSRG